MKKFRAELSASSLDNLLKELTQYQTRVKNLETELPYELAKKAEEYITVELNNITDKDGNIDAAPGSYAYGNSAFAYLGGSQASYIEFGTGVSGRNSPHPLAEDVGWDYLSGTRIFQTKSGKIGWIYRSPLTGQYRFTEGIPAGMPVFKAAEKIKSEVYETSKEILE